MIENDTKRHLALAGGIVLGFLVRIGLPAAAIIVVLVFLMGCFGATSGTFADIRNWEGNVRADLINTNNVADIKGTEVNALTQSGRAAGAGKLFKVSIRDGSGTIEIKTFGTGNVGFNGSLKDLTKRSQEDED